MWASPALEGVIGGQRSRADGCLAARNAAMALVRPQLRIGGPNPCVRSIIARPCGRRGRVWHAGEGGGDSGAADAGRVFLFAGVGFAASKLVGLAREVAIASALGVTPLADVYSQATVLPSVAAALLGGANGPLHSAVAATLPSLPRPLWRGYLLRVSLVAAAVGAAAAFALACVAAPVMGALAPTPSALVGRSTAGALLALLLAATPFSLAFGVASGALAVLSMDGASSSALAALAPAIAPSVPNGMGMAGLALGPLLTSTVPRDVACTFGLAAGVALGTAAQCVAAAALSRRLTGGGDCEGGRFGSRAFGEALRRTASLVGPGVVSLGTLQLATLADVVMAGKFPGAPAALGYANLLAMAPIGVLSSALLVPALPALSRAHARGPGPFRACLASHLGASIALGVPLACVGSALAPAAVRVLLQRGSFGQEATALVTSLLQTYLVGAPAYLARDVLVRACYAAGAGWAPLAVSALAVAANVPLNALLSGASYLAPSADPSAALGPAGLVLATVAVHALSAAALLLALQPGFCCMSAPRMLRLLPFIISRAALAVVAAPVAAVAMGAAVGLGLPVVAHHPVPLVQGYLCLILRLAAALVGATIAPAPMKGLGALALAGAVGLAASAVALAPLLRGRGGGGGLAAVGVIRLHCEPQGVGHWRVVVSFN